jgi:hypothetical protein
LVKLSGDMKEKLFLAQVTFEYMKNMLFNRTLPQMNVIFNEKKEKIVIAFESIRNVPKAEIKAKIMEHINQFSDSVQKINFNFTSTQILMSFDKEAIKDNLIFYLAEIQKVIQSLKTVDYK